MSGVSPSARAWRQDLHAHTTMSDGTVTLAGVARLAEARGVEIGVADHVSTRNPRLMIATRERVEAYLEALEGASVYRSAEFCWCDTLWSTLPEHLMDRFDYRIGSNHGFWLPDGGMGSPWWTSLPAPWAGDPQGLMDVLVANLCDMVRAMPIEIAAHSTLIPAAFLEMDRDVHAWWTPAREDRYVEALAESGVALEISDRYRLPHERLLKKAREAGVRFSLGSDGHHADQLGRLEWAVGAARRAGITEGDLFVPERRLRKAA